MDGLYRCVYKNHWRMPWLDAQLNPPEPDKRTPLQRAISVLVRATHFQPPGWDNWSDVCESAGVVYQDCLVEFLCGSTPGFLWHNGRKHEFLLAPNTQLIVQTPEPVLYPVIHKGVPKRVQHRQVYRFCSEAVITELKRA